MLTGKNGRRLNDVDIAGRLHLLQAPLRLILGHPKLEPLPSFYYFLLQGQKKLNSFSLFRVVIPGEEEFRIKDDFLNANLCFA